MYSNLNLSKYEKLLKSVGSLSKIYSTSDVPLVHSRFIEKLFIEASLNEVVDLTRSDVSFDCLENKNKGVGIKTFTSPKSSSNEKIAEFNNVSHSFEGLDEQQLSIAVSEARNTRIISDASELGVDVSKSYYHCLVRQSGSALIHEEPLELIDIKNLKLLKNKRTKYPFFTDGKSEYSFNPTKSTLFKKFEINKFFSSEKIEIPMIAEDKVFDVLSNFHSSLSENVFEQKIQATLDFSTNKEVDDFVILPLYGQRNYKFVEEKSGINAWNAGGRVRNFGESYIVIPKIVHEIKPNFFPPRDHKFLTKLPNNQIISTKVSQDGDKAFQSDPLTDLCMWLYKTIDLDLDKSKSRFRKKQIYTYADLERVGKDSVKIIKVKDKNYQYEMHTMPLNSFEEFKEN